jgi:NitT/TauT family transport system ATP-binding protein
MSNLNVKIMNNEDSFISKQINNKFVSNKILISISNLEKKFSVNNKDIFVFKKLNLNIYKGEFFVILGPNGCGKTTFLDIIAGLTNYNKGKIIFNNDLQRKNMGVVFQESSIYPWKTILDNILIGPIIKDINRNKSKKLALFYLNYFNLLKFKGEYPFKLSAGMKQKVCLIRALIINPNILLMDEPLTNLDITSKKLLQNEIIKLWRKTRKTIIYVTHDVDEALVMATRIVLFDKLGSIKKIIKIKENNLKNKYYFSKLKNEILEVLK